MRDIKFKYIFKGLPFSAVNNGFNWHVKIFTLKQIEAGVIHLSNLENNLGELVARVQFTGLTDKNGVEIYEGDIIKCPVQPDYSHHVGPVTYSSPSFTVDDYDEGDYYDGDKSECWDWSEFEVIGNIHENPELLK